MNDDLTLYFEPVGLERPPQPYVRCDEDCRALKEPQTEAELRAALEHWRNHGVLGGCSHGR